MSLVDDDAKTLVLQVCANGLQDEWELMHNGNDDFLAAFQMIPQRLSTVCPSHQVLQAFEGNDVVPNLSVKIHTVCHYYYAIQ